MSAASRQGPDAASRRDTRKIRACRRPLLHEFDAEPRLVEPSDLAGFALLAREGKLEPGGDSVGRLHLQAGPCCRKILDRARHPPTAEKNLPGFERSQARGGSAVVHGAFLQ